MENVHFLPFNCEKLLKMKKIILQLFKSEVRTPCHKILDENLTFFLRKSLDLWRLVHITRISSILSQNCNNCHFKQNGRKSFLEIWRSLTLSTAHTHCEVFLFASAFTYQEEELLQIRKFILQNSFAYDKALLFILSVREGNLSDAVR